MKKVICSPGSYIQGNGEIKNLAEYYSALGSKGAYIIVDKFIYDNYKDQIESSFKTTNVPVTLAIFGGECSMNEINKHKELLGNSDVVFGIGGGKSLDTAKAVAYYSKLPTIIVPTIASTDAPCSRLSVVYTEKGEFESYLSLNSNPNIVIMDLDVIIQAPVRFLVAGIGDALATYFEAYACSISDAVSMAGGTSTKAALALAELCFDTLLEDGLKAKIAVENRVSSKAVENIVEANTYLSGIGFESSGLAAAHAIHNGITVLEQTHHMLHGEKVAFGTISQLVLENRPLEEIVEIIDFCKSVGLPTTFKELGIENVTDEELMKVATASCADGETIFNMPFEVTPTSVFAAMKIADKLSKEL